MKTRPLRLGMCPLWMETPPLWIGDVLFTDGNAAARTFGRAHRRRPYHFSCGSVSQGCWKRLCRRAKTKMIAGRGSADGLKQEKVAGRGSADGLKREKVAGRGSADGLKQEKVAGRGSADGLKTRNDCRKRLCRWTKTENTSRNAHFWRGFSAEYAKKMAFLAFGLRNPTFFYYFCG